MTRFIKVDASDVDIVLSHTRGEHVTATDLRAARNALQRALDESTSNPHESTSNPLAHIQMRLDRLEEIAHEHAHQSGVVPPRWSTA